MNLGPLLRLLRLLTLTPGADTAGGLDLVVQAANANGQAVTAQVLTGGTVVGTATGTVGASLRVPVPNARLWTPDDPFLYDLRVALASGDTVGGYFGMRSLGKAMLGGTLRPTLNGRFVFQLGTLDQGYWPDGLYTAPTDTALRFDLEQQKALGFTMVRKHIKVENDRWFYWADRLGLMVWQDMPALASGREPSAAGRARFEKELKEMVDEHKGITSIVQWVPFNEGWGEYDAGRIADLVNSWDATRLVNHNSGSNCCDSDPDPGNGDVIDDRHANGTAAIAVINASSPTGDKQDATFWVRPGLSNSACYSFESRNFPGRFLRHRAYRVYQEASTGGTFNADATFCARPGLTGGGTSLEASNMAGYYLRHRNAEVWMDRDTGGSFSADATWGVVNPWWRSGADLATGQTRSFRVTTAGYDNRYLRHRDSLARTDVISAGSPLTDRQDATLTVRAGLADSTCSTFESVNFPGRYLRHAGYRLQIATNDGTAVFAQDATFCAQPGLNGGAGTLSLESINYPGYYWRHYAEAVYIATNGGGNTWDNPGSYAADATWNNAAPLG